jgi:hypothetical protein
MKTKHTKGEWVFEKFHPESNGFINVRLPDCKCITIYGKCITGLPSAERKKIVVEAEANAKLVAAAPEMLEALIILNNYIKEDSAIYRSSLQCQYIDELITKATK